LIASTEALSNTTFYIWDSRKYYNGSDYGIKIVAYDPANLQGEDISGGKFIIANAKNKIHNLAKLENEEEIYEEEMKNPIRAKEESDSEMDHDIFKEKIDRYADEFDDETDENISKMLDSIPIESDYENFDHLEHSSHDEL